MKLSSMKVIYIWLNCTNMHEILLIQNKERKINLRICHIKETELKITTHRILHRDKRHPKQVGYMAKDFCFVVYSTSQMRFFGASERDLSGLRSDLSVK